MYVFHWERPNSKTKYVLTTNYCSKLDKAQLCSVKPLAIRIYGEVELKLYSSLNLCTRGRQVVRFMPWLLYPNGAPTDH
jgi:hypothetical protein